MGAKMEKQGGGASRKKHKRERRSEKFPQGRTINGWKLSRKAKEVHILREKGDAKKCQ